MFPEAGRGKHSRSRDHKTYCFPEVPVNKCFVIYQLSKNNKKMGFPLFKRDYQRQSRKGSVIALVTLNYPTGTADPRKPLRTAIETGKFAGQDVKMSFVSPTSPPTEKPPSTLKPTNGPGQETPDAGQRGTGGGLSSGAIIAIVVVFSIIFVVIIVVLIVCMLKRKKPADSRKEYKEDGEYNKPAGSPLKSQPYREDPHDNTNDDRYPNGGGPPPQYTPSSNYAEEEKAGNYGRRILATAIFEASKNLQKFEMFAIFSHNPLIPEIGRLYHRWFGSVRHVFRRKFVETEYVECQSCWCHG
ncbi:hypothetical protein QZH41_006684 [Actinostola sp. cb2023]|nr:hypothetical protein QZH41_006684 [Actinostola sp. cb2023]